MSGKLVICLMLIPALWFMEKLEENIHNELWGHFHDENLIVDILDYGKA